MQKPSNWFYGLINAISSYLLKRKITQAITMMRLEKMLSDGKYIYPKTDSWILRYLTLLGITPGNIIPDMAKPVLQYIGLEWNLFKEIDEIRVHDYHQDTDIVIKDWINSCANLELLHTGSYPYGSNEEKPQKNFVGDRIIINQTLFLKYNNLPCVLNMRFKMQSLSWNLDVYFAEKMASEFLNELQAMLEKHMIAKYQGKIINAKFQEVALKTYKRQQLVYPQRLSKQVDQLLQCFENWFKNTKVNAWGYTLIGSPGTGKTSIGGLMAEIKPSACTYLYVPAAEINSPDDIKKIFSMAQIFSPCVVQIDDIDMISKDRRTDDNKAAMTSTLMESLDGLEKKGKIFLILTTNDPSKMDDAIINRAGRISNKIVFEGYGECFPELFQLYAKDFGIDQPRENIDRLMIECFEIIRDFSPDEVQNICQRLHLLYADTNISYLQLLESVTETHHSFHDQNLNQSHLRKQVGNGNTQSLTIESKAA